MPDDTPTVLPEEVLPASETQEPATVADTPVPQDMTIPTYHMAIWEAPPRYICLPCNYSDPSYDLLVTHLSTVHSLAPVPSVLVADLLGGGTMTQLVSKEFLMAEPTYRTEETPDGTKYLCVLCERAGTGHWSYDKDLFAQHQAQRHNGAMIAAPPAEAGEGEEDVPDPAAPPETPPVPPDQPEEGGQEPVHAATPGTAEPGA